MSHGIVGPTLVQVAPPSLERWMRFLRAPIIVDPSPSGATAVTDEGICVQVAPPSALFNRRSVLLPVSTVLATTTAGFSGALAKMRAVKVVVAPAVALAELTHHPA